ncbi:restriction endonuclease subunit S [Olleya aquimaris]|uniref:Type I restriction enzyme S subunit n=1 Tax=Olleya aquimaris TaxID=639310 RepID=A0A327RLE9_9FLAO|nr:restriction endonuclease subunit S [Olleya aquimaris]RAJ16373.1 type I restriction enzyme S subunit [Olleya aquimaris]
MKSNYKPLGNYIKQIKKKNTDGSVSVLKGIRINKEFMESVANIQGTDLSRYRVVEKYQFAYNPMHVGRDEILPISVLLEDEPIIVSPAYVVFEILDHNELDPEYLMMWCRRSEFDRNVWFTTDSSVRGGFSWESLCELELPIPSIEKQREIVAEYNTIVNRIKLNETLNQKLEDTAQALYKHWFVDKKNTDNENILLSDLVFQSKETIHPAKCKFDILEHYSIPNYDEKGLPSFEKTKTIRSHKYKVVSNSILLSKLNPRFPRVWNIYGIANENAVCSTEFLVFVPKTIDLFGFIYFVLKSNESIEYLTSRATGTSNSHQRIRPSEILDMPIPCFSKEEVLSFSLKTLWMLKRIRLNLKEIVKLNELKDLILSKMSKVETKTVEA